MNNANFDDSHLVMSSHESIQRSKSIDISVKDNSNFYFVEFEVRVKDNGMGISEEGLKKIFLNF